MGKHIASILFMLAVMALSASDLSAQVDRKDVRRGNRDFRKENWKEADIDYRKALVKDSLSLAANYNLASVLYRQEDMEQAAKVMDKIKETASVSEYSADYSYNRGDIALAAQDYQTAVDAFRQALLENPADMDAKENYIYAKQKLQEQQDQQNQNQDNQNQDNQNNQNQDNQNNQNQDNQDNQDNQNKDNQDQNQDQNQNQDQSQDQNQDQNQDDRNRPEITPQAAQQMLQAIQAKEKETQDKVNKEKAQALKSRQKEKNW
ncbi:MAG: tetratricopeptide repeat protein [Candidatus Cryptobacteroides sp.]